MNGKVYPSSKLLFVDNHLFMFKYIPKSEHIDPLQWKESAQVNVHLKNNKPQFL